jgi:hypothetical protein
MWSLKGPLSTLGKTVPAQPGNQSCRGADRAQEECTQENPMMMETKVRGGCDSAHGIFQNPPQALLKSHQWIEAGCTSHVLLTPRDKYLAMVGTMVREKK